MLWCSGPNREPLHKLSPKGEYQGSRTPSFVNITLARARASTRHCSTFGHRPWPKSVFRDNWETYNGVILLSKGQVFLYHIVDMDEEHQPWGIVWLPQRSRNFPVHFPDGQPQPRWTVKANMILGPSLILSKKPLRNTHSHRWKTMASLALTIIYAETTSIWKKPTSSPPWQPFCSGMHCLFSNPNSAPMLNKARNMWDKAQRLLEKSGSDLFEAVAQENKVAW